MATVVLTDHAWPDVSIERKIVEDAGYQLVARHATASAAQVDEVVAEVQPAGILTCWAPAALHA
jgi:D-3-phosphoglycerate dehydrogenase / 2-oxoglutarate reductase